MIKRNIKTCSQSAKEKAYFGLVRPVLEYSSVVWDPWQENQIHSLEMVQRKAARFVCRRYHNTSSVSNMLHELGWQILEQRRYVNILCMSYKIQNQLGRYSSKPLPNTSLISI